MKKINVSVRKVERWLLLVMPVRTQDHQEWVEVGASTVGWSSGEGVEVETFTLAVVRGGSMWELVMPPLSLLVWVPGCRGS